MLNTLQQLRNSREEGFTLVELLIVIVIIGVLAAIAVPIFLNQQRAALRASYKADVRNTVVEIQTMLTKNPTAADTPGSGESDHTDPVWRKANPFKTIVYDKQSTIDPLKEKVSIVTANYAIFENYNGRYGLTQYVGVPSYKSWIVLGMGGYVNAEQTGYIGDVGWSYVYESYTGKFTESFLTPL